ncbi:hypothetical protein Tco_0200127 [Tanacetum coccineum]
MNETTIRPPAAITSAKVVAVSGLVHHYGNQRSRCCGCLVSVVRDVDEAIMAVDGIGDNIVIIHGRAKGLGKKSDNGLILEKSGVLAALAKSRVGAVHPFPSVGERGV